MVLETILAKSGLREGEEYVTQEHSTTTDGTRLRPDVIVNLPNGHRIVVASFAGATTHPSWFLNLRDRDANPGVRCRVQDGEFWSVPEILEGDNRAETWARLTADRRWYLDYQAKTDREIPLVRLREQS